MIDIDKLVADGAILGVTDPRVNHFVAHLEFSGGRLFWIEEYASDQHHTHRVEADDRKDNDGAGIGFYKDGKLVAYLAGYREWPEISTDDADESHARWLDRIDDGEGKRLWAECIEHARGELMGE